MTYYTVTLGLGGALAAAVAVEWTNHPAPLEGGTGWEPCLRLADGTWRFSSRDPEHAAAPHRRGPGPFSGLAIRYRLAPAGPWSAAAEPRKDIVILEMRDGEVVPVLPAVLAAPTLLGAGEIGTEITLDPGLWSGIPTPALGFQWRRDGANLPGETARAYLLGPADDRRALACAVTARNVAGTTVALAGPRVARHPAPRLLGALPEEIFDEGTGAQAVETAFAFAGAALAFAAEGATVDPSTGVLSIPTERPVSGAVVRVTAANSGGAVTATLRYTVEAAPARPLGAADVTVLRSVWRPEGQSRTFSPEVAFPGLAGETVEAIQFCTDPLTATAPVWHPVRSKAGEPGSWQLFAVNHPVPADAPDAALFQTGDPRLAGRLRFRWREAQLRDWSEESGAFVVPPPPPRPAATLTQLLAPAAAEVQAAMNYALGDYKVDYDFSGNAEGTAIGNVFAHGPVTILALEAFAGQTRALASTTGAFAGTRTGRQRVIEHFRRWVGSGTANRAPAGRAGYNAQYETRFVSAAAIMRATPSLWGLTEAQGGFSAAEKRRIDLVMKGCALGSLWILSDKNPFGWGFGAGGARTIRGYAAGRDNVPNFSLPPRLIPFLVDGYMRLNGETLQGFLTTFNRDEFAAEVLAAGGLTDLYNTYRRDWTTAVQLEEHAPGAVTSFGPGPTKLQLHRALRDDHPGGVFRGLGLTLDQGNEMFKLEFERFFNRIVRPGPSVDKQGDPLPGRETGPAPWNTTGYGLKINTTLQSDSEFGQQTVTANQLRAVIGARNPDGTTDKSAWAGLPNPGALGMMFELDTTDGGGGGNPAIRANMTYSYHGSSAFANLIVAGIVLGVIDKTDLDFSRTGGCFDRMRVGVTDFLYRTEHGFMEYSKGGVDHPSHNWSRNYIEGQNARFACWEGLWRVIDNWSRA